MLAPFGMLRTLKVKESLSEAVTFTNATSPRVTSIHLGTYVNFGGKLSAKKNGLKRFNLHPNYFSWIYSGTSSLDTFVQGKPPFRGLKIWSRKNLQFAVVTFTEGTPLFRVRDTFPQGP